MQSYSPGGANVPSRDTTEPSVCGGDAALTDYFDHLFYIVNVQGWQMSAINSLNCGLNRVLPSWQKLVSAIVFNKIY